MPVEAIMGASPVGRVVNGVAGVAQLVGGLLGKSKNERNLSNLANPTYSPNKAISDYYQSALNKYNSGTYNSAFYQNAEKTAQRNLGAGLGAMRDRRSALAAIPSLVEGADQSTDRAAVEAENMQRQNLGVLGQATGMKSADDRFAFDINKMMPFERRYSELSGKLQANNQMINAGINNISGAASGFRGGLGLFKKNPATRSPFNYEGTPLADTGGPSILNQPSPAAGISYIDPNSFTTF